MLRRECSVLTGPSCPSEAVVELFERCCQMRPLPCREVVERPSGPRSRHAWRCFGPWSLWEPKLARRVPRCAGKSRCGEKARAPLYTFGRDDPIGAPVPSETSHQMATAPCAVSCMRGKTVGSEGSRSETTRGRRPAAGNRCWEECTKD